MKALIQRVSHAHVKVDGLTISEIPHGLLVLVGVDKQDDVSKADKLAHKLLNYRIFADDDDKMNLNIKQSQGAMLLVSQFTLSADTQRGMRPSFTSAAPPDLALALYDYLCDQVALQVPMAKGSFGSNMQVSLTNDGPVTFLLEVP